MSAPSDKSGAEREQRQFELTEALQAAHDAGESYPDSVWAQRFDLEQPDVARLRRAIELLLPQDEEEACAGELPTPALPDDYEIRGELGRGGMGVVYRVHQKSLSRDLALKVLRPGELVARKALERFKREARSLARLRHPHIASLHEVGECEGRVYFTMDLIEGRSLAQRIAEGPITPSQATRWMRQVTSAVQYVHSHGLVHRDIKPANILIDEEDNACVVDFGLARDVEMSSDLTLSDHFLGTPAYMSPEQARGDLGQVGEASDIYSIGVVLYECLTGQRAFGGNSIVEVVQAVCEGGAIAPSQLEPRVPMALELICRKAMRCVVEDRYPTARALLEDLERFEAGESVLAEPPSWKHRLRDAWQRNGHSLRVSGFTAVVMVALFGAWTVGPTPVDPPHALLAPANSLLSEGKLDGALALYAEVFDLAEDSPTAWRDGLGYADALLQEATARVATDGHDRASASARGCYTLALEALIQLKARDVRETLGDRLPRRKLAWAERLVRAAAFLRAERDLRDALNELRGAVRDVRESGDDGPLPLELLEGWRGIWTAELLMLESTLPALLDARSAGHGDALKLWNETMSRGARSTVRTWVVEELDDPEAILEALPDSETLFGGAALQRIAERRQAQSSGPGKVVRLRLAALRYSLGAASPTLRESRFVEVNVGREFRVPFTLVAPQLLLEPGESGSLLMDLQLRGSVQAGAQGLELEWRTPRSAQLLDGDVALHLTPGGRRGGVGDVTQAAYLAFSRTRLQRGTEKHLPEVQHFLAGEELWLACLEEADAPSETWDLAEWSARLERQASKNPSRSNASLLQLVAGASAMREIPDGSAREGLTKRLWLTSADAKEREQLSAERGFDDYPLDMRAALIAGRGRLRGGLSAEELRTLQRQREGEVREGRKDAVLKGVIGVFAFILIGGVLAGMWQAWRYFRTGKWRKGRAWMTRDQRAVTSLAGLPFLLMLYFQLGHSRVPGHPEPTAILILMVSLSAVFLVGVERSSGWGALKFTLVPFILAGWALALDESLAERVWVLNLWVATCFLPYAFDRYWDWHPKPEKGRRWRRIAHTVFGVGFAVPVGWLILRGPSAALRLEEGESRLIWYTLAGWVGIGTWIAMINVATSSRRNIIVKEMHQAGVESMRARLAAARATRG